MYGVRMIIGDNDFYKVEMPFVTGRAENYKEEYEDRTEYVDVFPTYKRAWDFYLANKGETDK